MERGPTGRFDVTRVGGEEVRAFVPNPLPPEPPLELSGGRQRLLERAILALGRLDSITTLLPDPQLFLYAYVRREAVLSSQIEGTQSSLSDLLLFELEEAPGVPFDDVVEVSNYVAALEHGMAGSAAASLCRIALFARCTNSCSRADEEARSNPASSGDRRTGSAARDPVTRTSCRHRPRSSTTDVCARTHVPRAQHGYYPVLMTAALAHVQFETIHPFLDGNGRIGRLMIRCCCTTPDLQQPLLYLSLYFKQHRDESYRLLDRVRALRRLGILARLLP